MSTNNEDDVYDRLFDAYPGVQRIAELTEGITKLITIDIEPLMNTIKVLEERISEAIRPIYEFSLPVAIENLGEKFKIFADGALLYRLQSLGILEWCNIDEWIKVDVKEVGEDSILTFSDWVLLRLEQEDNFSIDQVDRYVGRRFSKEILKNIEEDTIALLSEKDSNKLKKAMIDFRGRRYLDSANLLASLIDSQNIKQELFDVKTGRYQDKFLKKDSTPNVSQGWKSFYHVFSNNFAIHFGGEEFSGDGKQAIREEKFDKFIEQIKGKIPDNETVISIIALSICLFNFFSDSEWTDYPENKPTVINRHWLMHGMYDLEDVTRYDCIKLLLMLNQISKLYAKLKNGEI